MSAKMLDTMPREYRRDSWVQVIFRAAQGALDGDVLDEARQLACELLLDQMSERQLAIEERLCGITPPVTATADDRKAAVAARWRSGGKVGVDELQEICNRWSNGDVEVRYVDNTLQIEFVGIYGVPADMATLQDAIAAIVPAHIPLEYIIKYKLWRDFADKTWADLADMTWAEAQEQEV